MGSQGKLIYVFKPLLTAVYSSKEVIEVSGKALKGQAISHTVA
jgi:hypothetical protein